jgi:benzoate/toluate 1,2-dioxygenase beta subunit/2,4,5-trichlorophenoxyacetic acid oxygenase 2
LTQALDQQERQMNDLSNTAVAADVLHREGLYLDRQDWDAWLNLYLEDAVFWLPTWKDEHCATDDPDTQVSLIYHSSRFELEERVKRIRSRKSVTALPLPRTVHTVSNLIVIDAEADVLNTAASWTAYVYDPRTAKQHVHFGHYEHTLRRNDGGLWQIARKKIILVNDQVPTVLDFYNL